MNTITVKVKDVYGQRTFYPECPDALRFAAIAGTKTLTERVLRNIAELGYTIQFMREEVKLFPETINAKEFRL